MEAVEGSGVLGAENLGDGDVFHHAPVDQLTLLFRVKASGLVYVYINICVYTYVCMCIYIYKYIYIKIYTHIYVYNQQNTVFLVIQPRAKSLRSSYTGLCIPRVIRFTPELGRPPLSHEFMSTRKKILLGHGAVKMPGCAQVLDLDGGVQKHRERPVSLLPTRSGVCDLLLRDYAQA